MKQVTLLASLLVVALVASYLTATAPVEPATAPGQVALYAGSPEDLQRLVWTSKTSKITIEPRQDGQERYLWVTVDTFPPPDAPDPDTPGRDDPDTAAPDPDAPHAEVTTRSFMGSAFAREVWERFAPLYAVRELVVPEGTELETGTSDPIGRVALTFPSGTKHLVVGNPTPGNRTRYLAFNGKSYLITSGDLVGLTTASQRLMERRLHDLSEVSHIEVVQQGQSRSFALHNPDDRTNRYWADEATPEVPAKAEGSYLDSVMRLTVARYAPQAPGELTPVLTLRLNRGAAEVVVLKGAGESPEYYVRSAFNRGLVVLHSSRAQAAVEDAMRVIEGG